MDPLTLLWGSLLVAYAGMQVYIALYVRRTPLNLVPPPSNPTPLLLAARNEGDTLARTLPTLTGQRWPLRILVGDDASQDKTGAVCRTYLASPHQVVSVPPQMHALYPGKHAVLAYLEQWLEVEGEAIGVVDADMLLPPTWAAGLYAALQTQADIGGVCGPSLPEVKAIWHGFQRVEWASILYLIAATQGRGDPPPTAIGNSLLLKVIAWRSVGGWRGLRPSLVEDYELMQALYWAGWRFKWVFHPMVYAETRPEKRLSGWWHQRLRWQKAVRALPWLALFYWTVQVCIPWALLTGPSWGFGIWAFAEAWPLWRLRQALGTSQIMRFLPLLMIYRYGQGLVMVLLALYRGSLLWRGRRYIR